MHATRIEDPVFETDLWGKRAARQVGHALHFAAKPRLAHAAAGLLREELVKFPGFGPVLIPDRANFVRRHVEVDEPILKGVKSPKRLLPREEVHEKRLNRIVLEDIDAAPQQAKPLVKSL